MSRGAQAQTQQLTDQQLSSINALNQGFLGQQQQLGGLLTPQYQSILNNPGLSSADKAAVTSQSQGSIASAFDSLQQSAANRVARTNNSAGFASLSDDLARQKGIAEGNQAAQNQLSFDNTAFQRQMAALQGLSGLYGVDSNLLGRTLGIPAQLLNVRANASRPTGFFSFCITDTLPEPLPPLCSTIQASSRLRLKRQRLPSLNAGTSPSLA